jgi:hypothetical protein
MVTTMNDPVIDEVRRVRKLISDEIGPELSGLVDHYAKYQSRFKRKPIHPTDRPSKRSNEVANQPLTDSGSTPASR